MDLDNVRASLVEQGWTPRPGKGTHVVWKPPDGRSRPVTISNGWNGRRLANLRSTLRKAGWIDPERVQQQSSLARGRNAGPGHMDTRAPMAAPPPAAAEGSDMTSADQSIVVEEAWATNSHTRKISDCIKEQLLSDGTVQFRCAHRLGAGCTYTSDKLMSVAAHQRLHRLPTLTSRALTRKTMPKPTGTSRMSKTAQERTNDARDSVERQIEHTVKLALDRKEEVRTHAILPYGLGAGAVTQTVWLIASPTGEVTYECGEASCSYTAASFGSVFSHRSRLHRGGGETARRTSGTSVPDTTVGSALTEALQRREAEASVALDHDPRAQTISFGDPIPPGPAAQEFGPAQPKPRPPVLNGAAPVAQANGGGTFPDAVGFVREHLTMMVDHLGTLAAAEYGASADAKGLREELERVKAQWEEAQRTVRTLQGELEDLRAERTKLLTDHNRLEQLRGILGKV